MFFDNITIIICVVLAILAILSSLSDTFFRKMPASVYKINNDTREPVSVIIVADNNADELNENLKFFLEQDYPTGFEIIVVVDRNEDGTSDVLQSFAGTPNLYTTFVPDSSRYMSRRKLAITLGVKAAKHEWILLTDATCRPASEKWISTMATGRDKNMNMVLGYSNYAEGTGHFKTFYRLHKEYALLHEAINGNAYGTDGNNLMFRKSMFMAGNGFQGNLKYLRGEYDFIVNKFAGQGGVDIEIAPESHMIERIPSKKEWHNRNVFYAETRRHLSRGMKHRFNFNLDMLSFNACYPAVACAAAYAVIFRNWIVLSVACLALLLPWIVRIMNARYAMGTLDTFIPLWKVIPFETRIIWHNLKTAISHKTADKYDFISHKS